MQGHRGAGLKETLGPQPTWSKLDANPSSLVSLLKPTRSLPLSFKQSPNSFTGLPSPTPSKTCKAWGLPLASSHHSLFPSSYSELPSSLPGCFQSGFHLSHHMEHLSLSHLHLTATTYSSELSLNTIYTKKAFLTLVEVRSLCSVRIIPNISSLIIFINFVIIIDYESLLLNSKLHECRDYLEFHITIKLINRFSEAKFIRGTLGPSFSLV